ncbi:leucine-rich repeat-containing protein 40-like [Ptychodera flava]|uniref:leucine-rich repeat-containing protein 40-like n=1 Tax=Ptychodera flava TaxID=63121 RepID=UPI00396AA4D0
MSRRGAKFNRAAFQRQEEKPATPYAIIKQARASGQLNLSNRNLTEVPQEVWRINIDVPEEGKNVSLDTAGDRWWEQVDLVKLILASNKLQEISSDITQLPALTVLDVHDNQLSSITEAIGELINLQRLNLSHNKLISLPSEISNLFNLVFLHVEHNELCELGDEIGTLRSLEDLDLSHNHLVAIPTTIGRLTRLMKLNLSNNTLQTLPPEIGNLENVRILDLNHNKLKYIPVEIGKMKSLEQLYLRHNQLQELPELPACRSLKELHVGNNQITELSKAHLQHLGCISVLDVRDNKIKTVPDEIAMLESLQRLDLTNNDITSLPYKMGNLANLKSLVLDGNPLRSVRRDIVNRGTQAILKHLRSRIEEPPTDDTTDGSPVNEGSGASIASIGMVAAVQGKTLDYSDKKASTVPSTLWQPAIDAEVTSVNLSKNQLPELPLNVTVLAKTVTELNVGNNKLSSIPKELQIMVNLTHLDLRTNMLTSLPPDLHTLTNLREIVLSCNRFSEIPPVVYTFNKLENLLINDNQVSYLDVQGLLRLPALATLDVQNNSIAQVPPELGNLTSLRSLQLNGNLFRNPRPAVLAKGTLALLQYLRDKIPTP